MRGWKIWAVLGALLLAELSGALPEGREIEGLRLVDTLAVDGGGEITVTALTAARTTEEDEAEVFLGSGDSLAAACRDLRENSARRTYLGQAEQLLAGDDSEVPEVLDFVLTGGELRLDTAFYIVKGEAGAALEGSAEKAMGETGGRDPRKRTVGELLKRLTEEEYALAPALARNEEGGLAPAGWAVLGSEGVVGYLEGDAALGALLLCGEGEGEVVTLSDGAAEIESVWCWAGNGAVHCTLEVRAVQGELRMEEVETWAEEKIRAALKPGRDCWGLDRELAVLCPWDWEELRETDVSELAIKVTGKWVNGDEG